MSNFILTNSGELQVTEIYQSIINDLDFEDENDILIALNLAVEKWKFLLDSKKKSKTSIQEQGASTCAICISNICFISVSTNKKCPIYEYFGEISCPPVYYRAARELRHSNKYTYTEEMYNFMLEVLDWYKKEKM